MLTKGQGKAASWNKALDIWPFLILTRLHPKPQGAAGESWGRTQTTDLKSQLPPHAVKGALLWLPAI